MEEEQKAAYKAFQEDLLSELRAALHAGSRRLLGKYLQALLGYSDSPWVKETISDGSRVIAESTPLKEDKLYPKEIELVRICQEAKNAGRKTVVYAIHTDTRDLTQRLKTILEESGLRADILQASKVRPKKREEWIQSNRSDVLITHPRNVQTGLDLINFPEVVWYQQDYSVYVLRQASRRSWRIGQTKPVNVHYLFYQSSIQDKAIKLNIQKLRTALLTEGDLVDEGLVAQAEEDSLISLAKAIISQSDETASLESELERLKAVSTESDFIVPEQDSLQEPPEEKTELKAEEPTRPEKARAVEPASLPQSPSLVKKPAVKTRRGTVDSNQLALFSFGEAAG
jgi:SNF2 family DNA or RNA helicase